MRWRAPHVRACAEERPCLPEGDLLYFPRGWVHQAVTGTAPSHHITLSTYQKHNPKTLLRAAFEQALDALAVDSLELR